MYTHHQYRTITTKMSPKLHLFWWITWLTVGVLVWGLIIATVTRAVQPESYIATSWFGMRGTPRTTIVASCSNSGKQSVWIAETGTQFLDIIQVGSMNGVLFYAYGRGVPNGANSLYVEKHLGSSGSKWHYYSLILAAHVWTITIDGSVVARISDAFRTWKLHQTQVMVEGDLPFGKASCILPKGTWRVGNYGPMPVADFGANWWIVK